MSSNLQSIWRRSNLRHGLPKNSSEAGDCFGAPISFTNKWLLRLAMTDAAGA